MSVATSPFASAPKPLPPDLAIGGFVYKALFAKRTSISSAIALALSVVLPRGGDLGVSLCWFKRWTDLPCPGCGLTRCFVCLSHGHWREALHFHQLGPLVYLIAVASTVSLLIGEKHRTRLATFFSLHQRAAAFLYWGFIASFIAFGLVRLLLVWLLPGTLFPNV
jgi:hypothetical protein